MSKQIWNERALFLLGTADPSSIDWSQIPNNVRVLVEEKYKSHRIRAENAENEIKYYYEQHDALNVLKIFEDYGEIISGCCIVPTLPMMQKIITEIANDNVIFSVGSGQGIIEWILQELIPKKVVMGTDFEARNKYLPADKFIPATPDQCTIVPNVTALLFCYGSTRGLLESYLLAYPHVTTVIIIGTNDSHTSPNVDVLKNNSSWKIIDDSHHVTCINGNGSMVIYKRITAKQVLILGAESTGKTTLTEDLANIFAERGYRTKAVLEYAREWIDDKLEGDMNRLEYEHITHFGITQMKLVQECSHLYDIVFSDTDAIVSSIFQEIYYGRVDPLLITTMKSEKWDLVLLTHVDVEWVDDGQRNLSHMRQAIHTKFEDTLDELGMTYINVKGNWNERKAIAIETVNALL
jgi:nicotinamide riboside kinase